jgi:hypothetical protein
MPSKLAPHLASAPDSAAARGLLQAEINHAIAHLACEHISAAELIGDAALNCGERPDGSQPETAAARDRGAARAGKSSEGDSRRLAARRASGQLANTKELAAELIGARQRKDDPMNEKKRRAYTEAETESLLRLCRRNGHGISQALNFFLARTPLSELRALRYGEPHPDAGTEPPPDCPREDCPHKKEDDDQPGDALKAATAVAATGWEEVLAAVNSEVR